MIHAIAPAAQVYDYEADGDHAGWIEVLNAIEGDGNATIVSISWGACEAVWGRVPDYEAAVQEWGFVDAGEESA